jgi:hypothetical protein
VSSCVFIAPPEPACLHQAALLAGVRAQHLLQRTLQQVGGRVVSADALPQ